MSDIDMTIPACLKRTGPPKKVRTPKWAKVHPVPKPTGERYEEAERWEVFVESTKHLMSNIGCGLRRLWVAEAEDGSRVVYLHDGEHEASLPMADWARLQAKARRIA